MNNSYNYADFVGLDLKSDEAFEPYGYPPETSFHTYSEENAKEQRIENMLLNHSKYYIYCE